MRTEDPRALAAADVVCGDTALLVGGTGECDQGGGAGHHVGDLDGVANGVDIRVARAHGGIDLDAPAQAELKPRLACERRFGCNSDGEHDEVAFEDASICEGGKDRVRCFLKTGDVGFEQQLDAVLAEMVVEQRGHICVKNGDDMLAALDDRDLDAAIAQVFGHFEADEAGAHDHGSPRPPAFDELGDAVRVLDGAKREQALGVDAG